MNDLSVQDWRMFLKARIDQEQGRDAEALRVFDDLLQKHPTNPHLAASRTFALQRMGRTGEAAVATLAAKYAGLGRTLVGENDKPEEWTNSLRSLLGDLDDFEKNGRLAATMVVW